MCWYKEKQRASKGLSFPSCQTEQASLILLVLREFTGAGLRVSDAWWIEVQSWHYLRAWINILSPPQKKSGCRQQVKPGIRVGEREFNKPKLTAPPNIPNDDRTFSTRTRWIGNGLLPVLCCDSWFLWQLNVFFQEIQPLWIKWQDKCSYKALMRFLCCWTQ